RHGVRNQLSQAPMAVVVDVKLQALPEFADVARPVVALQYLQILRLKLFDPIRRLRPASLPFFGGQEAVTVLVGRERRPDTPRPALVLVHRAEDGLGEFTDNVSTLPEGWDRDSVSLNSPVQVLTEPARADKVLQHFIGRHEN